MVLQSILVFSLAPLLFTSGAAAQSPLPGWPQALGDTSSMFAPPTLADVTGDGRIDVVSVVGSPLQIGTTTEGIYGFDAGGLELLDGDNDPTTVGVFRDIDFGPSHKRQPVTLGELDGLPGDEILYYSGNTLRAIRGDGVDLPGWPLHFPSTEAFSYLPIMVADVDGDLFEDVIFATGFDVTGEFTRLHVVDRFGAPLPGWPVTLPHDAFGIHIHNGVVGNFDGDDELEIVVCSASGTPYPQKLVMFDHRGGRVWSRTIAVHDMVAADIDGDGRLELVVLEFPRVENDTWVVHLFVLTGEGERRSHAAITLGPYIEQTSTATIAGIPNVVVRRKSRAYTGAHPNNERYPDVLFLGTVDAGPSLEAVFSVRFIDIEVYGQMVEVQFPTIFEHWGATFAVDLRDMQVLSGFPLHHPYVEGLLTPPYDRWISADRLVDLDGDGLQEIVTTEHEALATGPDEVTLRFWNSAGVELLEYDVHAWTPAIGLVLEPTLRRLSFGDIDKNGQLDFGINMRRGELHLVTLPSSIDPTSRHPHGSWPVARQNTRRTGALGP